MKLRNPRSGDVLEMPPPNEIGESFLLLNGVILERLLFSDETNSITTGTGRVFEAGGAEFIAYVGALLAENGGAR